MPPLLGFDYQALFFVVALLNLSQHFQVYLCTLLFNSANETLFSWMHLRRVTILISVNILCNPHSKLPHDYSTLHSDSWSYWCAPKAWEERIAGSYGNMERKCHTEIEQHEPISHIICRYFIQGFWVGRSNLEQIFATWSLCLYQFLSIYPPWCGWQYEMEALELQEIIVNSTPLIKLFILCLFFYNRAPFLFWEICWIGNKSTSIQGFPVTGLISRGDKS